MVIITLSRILCRLENRGSPTRTHQGLDWAGSMNHTCSSEHNHTLCELATLPISSDQQPVTHPRHILKRTPCSPDKAPTCVTSFFFTPWVPASSNHTADVGLSIDINTIRVPLFPRPPEACRRHHTAPREAATRIQIDNGNCKTALSFDSGGFVHSARRCVSRAPSPELCTRTVALFDFRAQEVFRRSQ
jgi:hypothetical protein